MRRKLRSWLVLPSVGKSTVDRETACVKVSEAEKRLKFLRNNTKLRQGLSSDGGSKDKQGSDNFVPCRP